MSLTDTNMIGTLDEGEPHPAAYDAKQWIMDYVRQNDASALPILLGLAWTMRNMENE